jgi:hypothetical protein
VNGVALEVTFWEGVWWIFVMFAWILFFWMFIAIFADILRRRDLSGIKKALWILAIFVLPLLGILIYMIVRPVTEQDREMAVQMQQQARVASGYSAADEIAKLQGLKDSGAITAEEFEQMKRKALA